MPRVLAGLFLTALGVALVFWRVPLTRRVIVILALGAAPKEEAETVLRPLSWLTAVLGVIGVVLGLLLLLDAWLLR